MIERTFRITPNPKKLAKEATNDIKDKYIEKTFISNPKYTKFIITREYVDINDKFSLHYHGYLQTVLSINSVRGHLKGSCAKQYSGNEYTSISKRDTIDDYARNYICKDGDVLYYKGYTKKDIENFIKEGKEYKEKGTLFKMKWLKRVWYYIEEKGYKEKLEKVYRRKYYFNIEKNILPIILEISSYLNVNPPPPHIYQQIRMSVLRILFPKAFQKWYISYIEDSMKFKGTSYLRNPDNEPILESDLQFELSSDIELNDELEPNCVNI